MSFSAEHSDTSNSSPSQTLKDLIKSNRNVFPTQIGDFHQHVGTGTDEVFIVVVIHVLER